MEIVNTIAEPRSKILRNRVFSIAICRPTGDKWQSKTLFLANFEPQRRLLVTFSIADYPV